MLFRSLSPVLVSGNSSAIELIKNVISPQYCALFQCSRRLQNCVHVQYVYYIVQLSRMALVDAYITKMIFICS